MTSSLVINVDDQHHGNFQLAINSKQAWKQDSQQNDYFILMALGKKKRNKIIIFFFFLLFCLHRQMAFGWLYDCIQFWGQSRILSIGEKYTLNCNKYLRYETKRNEISIQYFIHFISFYLFFIQIEHAMLLNEGLWMIHRGILHQRKFVFLFLISGCCKSSYLWKKIILKVKWDEKTHAIDTFYACYMFWKPFCMTSNLRHDEFRLLFVKFQKKVLWECSTKFHWKNTYFPYTSTKLLWNAN